MTASIDQQRARTRLPFLLTLLVACLVFAIHPLPAIALLTHIRNFLAGLLPFSIGLPYGLALVKPRQPGEKRLDLERWLFAIGLGHGMVYGLTFLLLTVGLAYRPAFLLLTGALIVSSFKRWRLILREVARYVKTITSESDCSRSVCVFLLSAGILYLGCALLPPTNYDALEYHLFVPEVWLKNHGWVDFPHNIYAWFPMNTELFYLWGISLGDSPAATVINLLFAAFSGAAVWALARHGGSGTGAWLAVILFVSSGLVMRLVMQADIDLGVCFYSILSLLAFFRWTSSSERGNSILSAVFAGLALGCKYIAVISVWLPMLTLIIMLRPFKDRLRAFLRMLLLPACIAAPWLARNVLMTGNPVFPLLYNWLNGDRWSPAAYEFFRAAHSPAPQGLEAHLLELVRSPFDLTIANLTVFSPLILVGVVIILLFRRDHRSVRPLLLFCVVVFTLWFIFTQRNQRFLVTLTPVLSVLGAWGLEGSRNWFNSAIRWPIWTICYASLYFLLLGLVLNQGLRFIAGLETVEEYYNRVLPHMRAVDFLNEKNSIRPIRALFVGEAQGYRCQFDAIVAVVFNQHPWLLHDKYGHVIAQTKEEALQRLHEMGVTHILYNESELTRLIRGYAPEGWPDGRELARLILLMKGVYLHPVFETEDGAITVFEVKNADTEQNERSENDEKRAESYSGASGTFGTGGSERYIRKSRNVAHRSAPAWPLCVKTPTRNPGFTGNRPVPTTLCFPRPFQA